MSHKLVFLQSSSTSPEIPISNSWLTTLNQKRPFAKKSRFELSKYTSSITKVYSNIYVTHTHIFTIIYILTFMLSGGLTTVQARQKEHLY